MLYRAPDVTKGTSHVRDGIDLKRIMITVWLCTFPAMFYGMYNVGMQANMAMAELGLTAVEGWRGSFIEMFGGYDANSIWDSFWHGAAYFLPIYFVVFAVGGAWEVLLDRKSTRLNSSHVAISYAVFCLKKKTL